MDNANNRPPADTLSIVRLGGEVLRQKAVPVTKFGPQLEATTARMIEMLDEAGGVGLAAPQIGIGERFFVVRLKNNDPIVFVNPSIIETSSGATIYEEGCLSVPGIHADIVRAAAVKIQAFSTKGRPFVRECSGLLARVVQHETDHLDGILFFDHLSELKQKRFLERYEKIVRHEANLARKRR